MVQKVPKDGYRVENCLLTCVPQLPYSKAFDFIRFLCNFQGIKKKQKTKKYLPCINRET